MLFSLSIPLAGARLVDSLNAAEGARRTALYEYSSSVLDLKVYLCRFTQKSNKQLLLLF